MGDLEAHLLPSLISKAPPLSPVHLTHSFLSFPFVLFWVSLPVAIPSDMASKDSGQAFAPVLAAVSTLQGGNVPRSEKSEAHQFLEKFQKSVCQLPYSRFPAQEVTGKLEFKVTN